MWHTKGDVWLPLYSDSLTFYADFQVPNYGHNEANLCDGDSLVILIHNIE